MDLQAATKTRKIHPIWGGNTMNHKLINAAAICVIISTAYLAAKEIWMFSEARQVRAQIQDEETKAAIKDVLGAN
ncbi:MULTISPECIES: hypothetical protein [Mesorhizobium]|uniref:hypothetical protein n=1 Tax=Mesorhizobium TaxID=68287 RepID=UPI0007A93B7A|nr:MULTISPECIES: hypothetical protein [Mesorhizobium]AMX93597.1 hypothetical protein A4R28_11070 [Mesorhizobium ciceri]MDF3208289.1 hypothetical protein [Mesorhizobium sp. LMG15046]MDF3229139.1 hypothetical protein [Mesorhizobium sp. DSM 30133]RUU22246.1 hypothetical protein EOC84_03810 [Mesorhizobium sp. Primo-B]RUU37845.1 hypothetical protein EOC83_16405 [Mesorhizobium sp. Primo-A]